jgi:hypothetical protein
MTGLGLKLLAFTFVRPTESTGAKCDEFDRRFRDSTFRLLVTNPPWRSRNFESRRGPLCSRIYAPGISERL